MLENLYRYFVAGIALAVAEQEPKFNKGLIFVKDRDVLLTGDK